MKDQELIGQAIKDAIEKRTLEIIQEETAFLKERVAQRVKSEASQIAVKVFQHFSFERMGADLKITIHNQFKP